MRRSLKKRVGCGAVDYWVCVRPVSMRISSAEGHGGAVARSRGQLDRGKLRDATRSAPAAGEAENSEIRIERVA